MKDYQLNPRKVGKVFKDEDLMPFGKYAGEAMSEVPASYCLWLWDQGVEHPGVRGYIVVNFDALVKECPDKIVTPPSDAERKLYK